MLLSTHANHRRGHRVREQVCSYRTLRGDEGQAVHLPAVPLNEPTVAAHTLAPLLAGEPVEVFAVACLSTKRRLLAWHVLSRGTRQSTPVSLPDVFVPACLTPGTTGLIVVHNHPSGDPTPSQDDARLTLQLLRGRHPRPTERGQSPRMTRRRAITKRDSSASLGPVKPLRFAPTPSGLAGLTGPPGRLALA